MIRRWNEFVAGLADVMPGGVAGLVIAALLAATIIAMLWYTWPPQIRLPRLGGRSGSERKRFRWPSWRWRRLRWPRFRWRSPRFSWRWPRLLWRWLRRRKPAPVEPAELGPDELPDLPAEVLEMTADQLAAAGRYAEAVRERLRAIVRELVDRSVIEHHPGWTVTELARAAGWARPDASPPLTAAVDLFSEIWYGQRPAIMDDDVAMRQHASSVHEAVRRTPAERTS